jgi:energy-coupling factor transporter ATP-binding protein EcfA2
MFEAGIDSNGHSAIGKATILRLMASLIPPSKGLVLTATHKKFLYLDRYPHWVHGSILRNLRFGLPHHLRKSFDPNVCWAVAMACGLSPHFKESTIVIQPNKPHLLNEDAVAISLARAFLSMPDVLLVDAFGDVYGEPWITRHLLPLLRQYVKGGLREVVASFDAELANQVPMPPFPPSIIWSSRQTSGSMGDQILRLQDHKLEVFDC